MDLTPSGGMAPYTYSIDGCATSVDMGLFLDLCAGDYNICIEDDEGCQYTEVVNVAVGTPIADATITAVAPICLNVDPVSLIVSTAGGVFTGPGMVGGAFDPTVAGLGTHAVIYTVDGASGGADTIDITVTPLPTVSFMGDVLSGCAGITTNFTSTGDVGVDCDWNFGDGGTSNMCGPVSHNYTSSGIFDVSLTVTDANGCVNTATYNDYITIFEIPNASFVFSPDIVTTLNTEINFTDYSSGGDTWTWDFAGLANSNDQNPTYTFPQIAGNYDVKLIVETGSGCKDSLVKTILINEPLLIYVPNAFTPDGDTFNEEFLPYLNGIDIYDYHLTIYNRWGEIMFESYDVTAGWNGSYGDQLVEDGVYIWTIEAGDIATDKRLEYNGHVTVLK